MLELIKAGGLLMWPILVCSAISAAIITERFWTLQQERVAPKGLVAQVLQWTKSGHLTHGRIKRLHEKSKLGEILVAGLNNRSAEREMMKESIEEVGTSRCSFVGEIFKYARHDSVNFSLTRASRYGDRDD